MLGPLWLQFTCARASFVIAATPKLHPQVSTQNSLVLAITRAFGRIQWGWVIGHCSCNISYSQLLSRFHQDGNPSTSKEAKGCESKSSCRLQASGPRIPRHLSSGLWTRVSRPFNYSEALLSFFQKVFRLPRQGACNEFEELQVLLGYRGRERWWLASYCLTS